MYLLQEENGSSFAGILSHISLSLTTCNDCENTAVWAYDSRIYVDKEECEIHFTFKYMNILYIHLHMQVYMETK